MKKKEEGSRKYILISGILLVIILLLVFADLLSGSVQISPNMLFKSLFSENDGSSEWLSIHEFRIPRLMTGIVAGAGLSVSGLQMQTAFRNPLAGPYVLGISSGAGLGVAFLVMGFPGVVHFASGGGFSSFFLIISAWLGAAAVLLLILMFTLRMKSIMTILILGIMLGSGISAIISILQYFSEESALKIFVIWTMGSLNAVTSSQVPWLSAGFGIGIFLALFMIKPSNAMLMGENYARSLGVNITSYRILLFISTALLTGTITAFCGPVGFIGVAVPHIARFLTGSSRFGVLFGFSLLCGIIFMLICDIISQVPGSDLILPLNAVTSLMGIPVVIWIVIRQKKVYS